MDGKVNVRDEKRLKYKIITKGNKIGLHGMPAKKKKIIAEKQNKSETVGKKIKGFNAISLKHTEVLTCQFPDFSFEGYFRKKVYHMHGFIFFIRTK